MALVFTVVTGIAGGALATVLQAPIPWLLGSLLCTAALTSAGVHLKRLPGTLEKWMRVLVGVALGPSVANSLGNVGSSTLMAVLASLLSVVLLAAIGYGFFQRALGMSRGEAYLSALPGGLSFMMALADELHVADKSSRPRIALVHTVRVVSLVLFVSLIAMLLGTDLQKGSFWEWFAIAISLEWQWLVLLVVIVLSMWLAETLSIAGGHVTIPLVISTVFYASGLITAPMPPLVITTAMLVFGCILGCELGSGPRSEYPKLAGGSLILTSIAFVFGALLALGLGEVSGYGFLVLFLALAPGGIAEVALIALALGLDVGIIAMVHLCRFLFIMIIGPIGLRRIDRHRSASDKRT
ncbi:MAG: AbrB family transcriptional regulator [Pseudomonadota bacterium]